MKETKNVPQLRFSGFDDEWEEKNFSDITYISATKNKSNLPLESYSITNENGFIPQDEQFENGGTMKDADKRMYWIVPPKSFGYNPARINVGSIGYYDGKKDVIVSSLYEIFKMTENCDDAFFWQWFKSDNLQKQVLKLQEGGVRLYFYYDKLCMGEIKIPSKGEQQKIGSLLSNLDSLIQAKTKKLESLKAVKKSLLQKCFPKAGEKVPEMRFAGFSGDWEEKNLGEVAEISSGTTPSRMNSENFSGDVCWLTSGELKSHYIYDTSEKINESIAETMRTYKKGTVVIAIYGLEAAGIRGTCSILKRDCTISQACMAFSNLKSVHNEFLYCWYIANGNEIGTKYAQGTKQQNLSSDIVSDMSICFPTLAEQQKIGQFFSKYDSLISAQQKEIDKLKNIKKSLLQKMFI